MALTLVATAQATNANSYATVAEAEAYFDGRANATTFTAAASATMALWLVMATSRLEQERYVGTPTSSTQRLQWPRSGVRDVTGNGLDYDSSAVPRLMKEAEYELALAIGNDTALLEDTGLEGFENVAVGPLDITPRAGRRGGDLPAQVVRLLRDLRDSAIGQLHVVRG